MTITVGIWAIPTMITCIVWLTAYWKDRRDPDIGSLWAYAAAGSTISIWIFYALLWLVV
jgi:hypothetical protein